MGSRLYRHPMHVEVQKQPPEASWFVRRVWDRLRSVSSQLFQLSVLSLNLMCPKMTVIQTQPPSSSSFVFHLCRHLLVSFRKACVIYEEGSASQGGALLCLRFCQKRKVSLQITRSISLQSEKVEVRGVAASPISVWCCHEISKMS